MNQRQPIGVSSLKTNPNGVNDNNASVSAPVAPSAGIAPGLLPYIETNERRLREISADALDAMLMGNSTKPFIFNRGGVLARIRSQEIGVTIESLNVPSLRGILERCANWIQTDPRGGVRLVSPSYEVVTDLLADPATVSRLPVIERVINAPLFAKSGELQSRAGYSADTRCYLHLAEHLSVPSVSNEPTQEEITRARELLLDDLLGDFPFVGVAEKAHAVAAILLPFMREIIGTNPTPLHLIESPIHGTGKTLLADAISTVAQGYPAPAMTVGRDEDEMRKRITATLLNGQQYVFLDNLPEELFSSFNVAAAITTGYWRDRELGKTHMLDIPVKATWLATGNNPRLSGELSRRSVRIRLDTGSARPWEDRKFKHADLLEWAKANRGDLIWAALTMGRAWLAQGMPPPTIDHLGGFQKWSAVIGGTLEVGGIDGFLENLGDFYTFADTEAQSFELFVMEWWAKYQGMQVSVKELFPLAEGVLDLRTSIKDTEHSMRIKFGNKLKKERDRRYGAYAINDAGSYQGAQTYRLVEAG